MVAVLTLLIVIASVSAVATAAKSQPGPGEIGVNFIKFACPVVTAEPFQDCETVTGASFRIEQDGVEIPGSPFTTGPTSLVPGFFFDVADGTTLTITELGGGPAGYVPAPGFDPLVIDVAAIPIGGCGGESTCPTIEFINIAETPATEPPTGTGRLTIYKAACPPGFTGTAYFDECFDNPVNDVEFFAGSIEARGMNPVLDGKTGPDGFLSFDIQTTGRNGVTEAVPEGYVDYAVVCTDAAGGAVAAKRLGSMTPPGGPTVTFGIELVVPAGADIRCDWYNIPAAGPTATATPSPAANPTETPSAASTQPRTPTPAPEMASRPVDIIVGSCEEDEADLASAESVAALTDLAAADGESVGLDVAAVPETSFTSIELSIDDLVAEEHAIVVGSVEDDDELVACGDIAGLLTESGDLVVALQQVDDSGFVGVAYLSPESSTDQTGVSVFFVEGLAEDGAPKAG